MCVCVCVCVCACVRACVCRHVDTHVRERERETVNVRLCVVLKTVDPPSFLFRAAVFIHLKSLFSACFRSCIN